jgi:hypothetical protein
VINRHWLRGATIMAMVASVDLAGITATQEGTSPRLVVDVDDPRPISAAARQLERQLGIAVTYEDGSYVAPEDIVDVTAQVRRDGRTEPRVLVMRGGAFRFEHALPGTTDAGRVHQVLSRLVETWSESRIGGEFTVVDAGAGFQLVPTSRRGVGGQREPYTPPLSVRIDLALEPRSGLETVDEIARLVYAQTGRPVGAGMMPINLMSQKSAVVGARNEPARTVLWRALRQLHPSLSYQVLCAVGEQAACTINIHAIRQD